MEDKQTLKQQMNEACFQKDVCLALALLDQGAPVPTVADVLPDPDSHLFDAILPRLSTDPREVSRCLGVAVNCATDEQLDAYLEHTKPTPAMFKIPLKVAARFQKISRFIQLCDHGADPIDKDAAYFALIYENMDVLSFQKAQGLNFDDLLQSDRPFRRALMTSSPSVRARFNEEIAALNPHAQRLAKAADGETSVMWALGMGADIWDVSPKARKLLFDTSDTPDILLSKLEHYGVDLHAKQGALLREAVAADNGNLVQAFIDRGVLPHAKKDTALTVAIRHGATQAAGVLVKHGLSPLEQSEKLLKEAAKKKPWESMRWLFQEHCFAEALNLAGAPPDVQSSYTAIKLKRRAMESTLNRPSIAHRKTL